MANFSVKTDCDGRWEQLPCPQGHDGNPDTCCTVPSYFSMMCDMIITFNNALKAAILEINSKPLPDSLDVVQSNGEALTVYRNGTKGDRALFLVPNGILIQSCTFQTRRLCELTASGRDHVDVLDVENEGPSTGMIAAIVGAVLAVVIFVALGVFCKKRWEARRSRQDANANMVRYLKCGEPGQVP